MRDSCNVDLYQDGKPHLRDGCVKLTSMVNSHSLWSDPKNSNPQISYYVAGSTMYAMTRNAGVLSSTSIVTGLAIGKKVAYCEVNGDIFWSNGIATGRIRNGTTNTEWGIENPASNPVLYAGAAGGLYLGDYQIALTYRNAAGEESGTGKAQKIRVGDNGSITLSNIPQPVSTEVTQIVIYASPANGDALFKVATIPRGQTSFVIGTVANAGTALKTQFLQQMPAGTRIAHLGGIIYVAVGNYVFFCEPFRYGLCDLNENFYGYASPVDELLMVPDDAGIRPQDGLYVCADKTYFILRAGSKEAEQKVIFPFGAVPGTGTYLKNGTEVAWFSPRGQITASIGGHAKICNDGNFMPGLMSSGASFVREKNGLRQIVNTVHQSAISPLEFKGA